MSELITLTGIVLMSTPSGEYDRRTVILTRERGKITAFARGARRPNSSMMGAVLPFCCGSFRLYEGRDSYTLAGADIDHHFEKIRTDLEATSYGSYFLELAGYYSRENLEAADMLNLLFVSLRALENEKIPDRLVRYAYEIRLMVINGEFPVQCADDETLSESARYALHYMIGAPLRRLYTFTLSEDVLEEIVRVQERIRPKVIEGRLKSLGFLNDMLLFVKDRQPAK